MGKQPPVWQNKIIRYGTQPASEFLAHPNNPRRHPVRQRKALRGSLDTLGFVAPIIVNERTGYLLDGHARVEECLTLNEDMPLPTIWVNLSEAEEKQFLLTFDYMTYMAQYDAQLVQSLAGDDDLRALVAQMDDEQRKAIEDIQASIAGIAVQEPAPAIDAEPQISRADELRVQWQTELGQLWLIRSQDGKRTHRVLCGDSTSEADVSRLMGGRKADCVVTDPPYGVQMDKGFGGFGGFGTPIARRQYADTWDSQRPQKDTFTLHIRQAKHAIIFGGNFFADLLPVSTHWIVWDKLQTMPTFGDCELAWTNLDRKSIKKYTVEYNGLIGKEKERYHPTQKPVKLFVALITDYTEPANTVFDPFLGSGTTLIAAEQTGRVCYGMELSPAYVAVILQRATDAGLTCEKEG